MFERFTGEAREVVVRAQAEARALRHDWIGTEHLLIAVLAEPQGTPSRLLAPFGVSAQTAREDVERILGPGEADLDAEALATIGIDLDEVRSRAERTFGPGALARRGRCRRGRMGPHLPFTPRAKKALELALREALDLHDREIRSDHLLLGLLREGEGVAARILGERGVDHATVRLAVAGDRAR